MLMSKDGRFWAKEIKKTDRIIKKNISGTETKILTNPVEKNRY
jgi:hypothetical protein